MLPAVVLGRLGASQARLRLCVPYWPWRALSPVVESRGLAGGAGSRLIDGAKSRRSSVIGGAASSVDRGSPWPRPRAESPPTLTPHRPALPRLIHRRGCVRPRTPSYDLADPAADARSQKPVPRAPPGSQPAQNRTGQNGTGRDGTGRDGTDSTTESGPRAQAHNAPHPAGRTVGSAVVPWQPTESRPEQNPENRKRPGQ